MILRWLTLTLFVLAFAPGLLYAQAQKSDPASPPPSPPPGVQGNPFLRSPGVQGYIPTDFKKMYEDIEIMRRILDRKLAPLYPSVTSTRTGEGTAFLTYDFGTVSTRAGNIATLWSTPQPNQTTTEQPAASTNPGYFTLYNREAPVSSATLLSSLEGVYLKRQGVVYTATLPSLELPAKAEADSTAKLLTWTIAHPESEWDNIRRQVRNEKEEPRKPEWRKPPSLSDVLLKVLAENGHHFSQLGENERLTIVLTVHEVSASSPPAKSGGGSAKIEPKPVPSGGGSDLRSKENDLELLGELHLKQGKYKEAIMALLKANELTKSPKRRADVCRKLAQCYLGMGEDEKAQTELNKAIALLKKEKEAKEKTAAKLAAALPIKLIISAPKKLLDQAKEGKITFEEFRRQASVETLRFDERR